VRLSASRLRRRSAVAFESPDAYFAALFLTAAPNLRFLPGADKPQARFALQAVLCHVVLALAPAFPW